MVLVSPLATLALTACAPNLGKMPQLNPFTAYATHKTLEQAKQAPWPNAEWWQAYNDPQLNALMTEALESAPTLAQAQARLNAAAAQAQQAGAAELPQSGAEATLTKLKQSYNNGVPAAFVPQNWNNSAHAELNFSYALDFFGKNRAILKAALSEHEAAAAEAAQTRLALTTSIAAAYGELTQLYADQESAKETVKIRTTTAKLFAQRYQNGLEHQGSLSQAQALQAAAEAEAAALEESLAHTRNRIAALLGQGPDRGLALTQPTLNLSNTVALPSNLEVNLLGQRPDVQAARLRAQAAAQRIKAARADYYPNINLNAYLGYQSLGLNELTRAGSEIGGIGPAINLPLFSGGRIEGTYRQARAEYDAAVATYNGALANALQEVADAYASKQALALQLQKNLQALQAAQRAHNVALSRYRNGLANYLEVLSAEEVLVGNQRTVANLQARSFVLDVAMAKALGGGMEMESPSSTTPPVISQKQS